jgi:hypothetical protein
MEFDDLNRCSSEDYIVFGISEFVSLGIFPAALTLTLAGRCDVAMFHHALYIKTYSIDWRIEEKAYYQKKRSAIKRHKNRHRTARTARKAEELSYVSKTKRKQKTKTFYQRPGTKGLNRRNFHRSLLLRTEINLLHLLYYPLHPHESLSLAYRVEVY